MLLDVYLRLSAGGGLQPPALAFVFDKETRSENEREELLRRLGGKVHFLPVRMFENYLVHPQAIATLASSIDGFFADDESAEPLHLVETWLNKNMWAERYFRSPVPEADRSPEKWREEAHGADLLADLFNDLSECRVPYEKVTYGSMLADWLLENSPVDLKEPSDFLEGILVAQGSGFE